LWLPEDILGDMHWFHGAMFCCLPENIIVKTRHATKTSPDKLEQN